MNLGVLLRWRPLSVHNKTFSNLENIQIKQRRRLQKKKKWKRRNFFGPGKIAGTISEGLTVVWQENLEVSSNAPKFPNHCPVIQNININIITIPVMNLCHLLAAVHTHGDIEINGVEFLCQSLKVCVCPTPMAPSPAFLHRCYMSRWKESKLIYQQLK